MVNLKVTKFSPTLPSKRKQVSVSAPIVLGKASFTRIFARGAGRVSNKPFFNMSFWLKLICAPSRRSRGSRRITNYDSSLQQLDLAKLREGFKWARFKLIALYCRLQSKGELHKPSRLATNEGCSYCGVIVARFCSLGQRETNRKCHSRQESVARWIDNRHLWMVT